MQGFLATTLLLLSLFSAASSFRNSNRAPSKDAILLSNVETLTLRSDRETSHRRVSPIPQLRCVGPSRKICSLYKIDVMQCRNQGSDYDHEDVQWSCSASLPREFKLGGTDVICEGYRDPDDKWILKGSCGVEYRLLLTDSGEARYGNLQNEYTTGSWVMIFIVFGVICYLFFMCCSNGANRRDWRRGGGFGGGGGGGRPPYDPPPPYDSWSYPSGSGLGSFRPGFWSGAALGGASGYGLGRRHRDTRSYDRDPWVGTSGSSSLNSRPSTGFGGTRRR